MPPEQARKLRKALFRLYRPSEKAQAPHPPVAAAAKAIRAALPDFKPWQIDLSQVDLSQVARQMFDDKGQAFSFLRPPGFTTVSEGAYITGSRAWLIQDEDGRFCTYYELMQQKASI